MATIRSGNKDVLLVVDVQTGVMADAWESQRIIGNIRTAVEKARKQQIPVIWVQHADDELPYESPAWQIVPELIPAEGERRIYKQYASSFEETPLEETLAVLGATRLFLTGASTNWCVRATAYAALDRGYDLTLVKDAHTTGPIIFKDGTRIEPEDVVRDLNVVISYLKYPGRKNMAVSAADLDFSGK